MDSSNGQFVKHRDEFHAHCSSWHAGCAATWGWTSGDRWSDEKHYPTVRSSVEQVLQVRGGSSGLSPHSELSFSTSCVLSPGEDPSVQFHEATQIHTGLA